MARTSKTPTVDPEVVAKEGFFAATENDDNSVAVSEPYAGVSPEYMNHANDTDKPLLSEDEEQRKIEEAAAAREAERAEAATKTGWRGYEVDTPHPSEARYPADDTIERNRLVSEAAAAAAAAQLSDDSSSEVQSDEKPGITP